VIRFSARIVAMRAERVSVQVDFISRSPWILALDFTDPVSTTCADHALNYFERESAMTATARNVFPDSLA